MASEETVAPASKTRATNASDLTTLDATLTDEGAKSGKKKQKGQKGFDWTKATFGHYVLKLAYLGTKYHGLAWQDPTQTTNCPTVEAKLFEALMKTCLIRDRSDCGYSRCGRTDKGVHAAGNYIALQLRRKPTKAGMAEEDYDYVTMLNAVLPGDIRILAQTCAPEGFDARFSCRWRAYQYYFPLSGEDLELMREAAAKFVGEYDFRNFCKMDVENVSNFRRQVLSVSVDAKPGGVGEFAVTGTAFLWHQIRCMAHILLLIGAGIEEPGLIEELLDVGRHPRKPVYELADESGLVLRDCGFENLSIAPGCPAPPAGSSLHTTGIAPSASAVDPLRQMHLQALRTAAVHGCLLDAAAMGDSTAVATAGTGGKKSGRHVPLLQRAKCPSLTEKTDALEAKRRRKEAEADDGPLEE